MITRIGTFIKGSSRLQTCHQSIARKTQRQSNIAPPEASLHCQFCVEYWHRSSIFTTSNLSPPNRHVRSQVDLVWSTALVHNASHRVIKTIRWPTSKLLYRIRFWFWSSWLWCTRWAPSVCHNKVAKVVSVHSSHSEVSTSKKRRHSIHQIPMCSRK